MPAAADHEITGLLLAWRGGEVGALADLIPLMHRELLGIARRYMRNERSSHTLQPTALVNEVYVRLVDANRVRWEDRSHFVAFAAQLMRRILVDSARMRESVKRGGQGQRTRLTTSLAAESRSFDILSLDSALERLAAIYPRKAQVVELRFFGGLTAREIAEVLGVSEDTVLLDWRMAKAWLARTLDPEVHRE